MLLESGGDNMVAATDPARNRPKVEQRWSYLSSDRCASFMPTGSSLVSLLLHVQIFISPYAYAPFFLRQAKLYVNIVYFTFYMCDIWYITDFWQFSNRTSICILSYFFYKSLIFTRKKKNDFYAPRVFTINKLKFNQTSWTVFEFFNIQKGGKHKNAKKSNVDESTERIYEDSTKSPEVPFFFKTPPWDFFYFFFLTPSALYLLIGFSVDWTRPSLRKIFPCRSWWSRIS